VGENYYAVEGKKSHSKLERINTESKTKEIKNQGLKLEEYLL
jgi:hypothetical protein